MPAENYERVEQKRVRKKKQTYQQRVQSEWDELAAEEAAYKKFKKGKLEKRTTNQYVPEYEEVTATTTIRSLLMALRTYKGCA